MADAPASGNLPARIRIEPLSPPDSWRYLQSAGAGRLALTADALPVIVPVLYTVVDDAIVFRAGSHRALSPSAAGTVVAFEAGEIQPAHEQGWTVLVRGVLRTLAHPDHALHQRPKSTASRSRDPLPDDVLLALQARIVEGHRLRFA